VLRNFLGPRATSVGESWGKYVRLKKIRRQLADSDLLAHIFMHMIY